MPTNTKTREANVRTDAAAKRVATAKRSAITVPEVEQHIATVLAEYGSTGDLMDAHKALEETARTTERGLRAWYPVAVEARAAGMTVRAFGELSGGSKDTLSRLARGAAITAAFERNGAATVSAVMVQSVANRTTDSQMTDLLKSIKPGRVDQLPALVAAVKAPKAKSEETAPESGTNSGRQSGSANSRESDWSIKPSQYVKALEIMAAYLTALPEDKAADFVKTLAPAVRTLAQAIQTAHGKVPAPGTKRAQG